MSHNLTQSVVVGDEFNKTFVRLAQQCGVFASLILTATKLAMVERLLLTHQRRGLFRLYFPHKDGMHFLDSPRTDIRQPFASFYDVKIFPNIIILL
jgi:hypothetical protein